MEEKLVIRISNNFGNQMFMYAAGYATSKLLFRKFLYDKTSSFQSRKNISTYALDEFNIKKSEADKRDIFIGLNGYLKRKLLKKIDLFKKSKNFLLEKYNDDKETFYNNSIFNEKLNKTVFMEGYFESEKYFEKYKDDLKSQFIPLKINTFKSNKYYKKILKENSVALCIRQNRFNDKESKFLKKDNIKSAQFLDEQIEYIKKAINYYNSKLNKVSFFVWSNEIINIKTFFKDENIQYVDNSDTVDPIQKIHLDHYLMTNCKHFAVIPSSFNWWAAWLSDSKNKIILRPKDNNFNTFKIKNKDYWPTNWKDI